MNQGQKVFYFPWWRPIITLFGLVAAKFPATPIETVLETYFCDLKMSQLLKHCPIPTYALEARQARFFTQHDVRKNTQKDCLVREIVRATSDNHSLS